MRYRCVIVAAALLGGCGIVETKDSASDSKFLIPNKVVNVSPSLHVPLEGLAAAVGIYFLIDPLAPNWQVAEEKLGGDRYRISLKMKRFTTGGDGEAIQVFHRSAERIAHDGGFVGFRVLRYSESLESNVLAAQRVGEGVIEMVRAPQ